ncbi:MAG: histidine phosphatase family protein [Pseudomonadota bacterium]
MKAYLIRHAKSSGQPREAPLSQEGYAKAEALVPVLKALEAGPIFSSPYRRAMETLAPYAKAVGQDITPIEDLRERLLSPVPLPDWQDHIRASFKDPDHRAEGGESQRDMMRRWTAALSHIAAAKGRPVFATHGGMTAALFHDLDPSFGFEGWKGLSNPDLFALDLEGPRLRSFARLELKVTS